MIWKISKKQAYKPIFKSEQLQALVTDLAEAKEGAIVGGRQKNWLVPSFKTNIDDITILLGGGGINEIRWDDKPGTEE
ncbi:MAG TPA: hypothetical protein DDZ80_27985 [Cyanobacteria bacterium UBA8803]|nr:hypothetical protein [Cyanobacteria bacterium UBA9273]HBL62105.1 hypothetical protein [Cyanobacteria bacterium UBA8803]